MKNIFLTTVMLTFVLLIASQVSNGQVVNMIDKGEGTYDFISTYREADLHFYLFDDGYHSFDKNPSHTYDFSSDSVDVIFHTSRPYHDVDIDEELVGNPNTGTQNVSRIPQDFENKIEVQESWNLVNDKYNYFIIKFENLESTSPISGCVEWHFNNTELSVNEGKTLDNYGNSWVSSRTLSTSDYPNEGFTHKYSWNYSNLAYEEQRFIYIHANCLKNEMEKVTSRGVMKSASCQFIAYNANNDGNENSINNSPYYTKINTVRGYPHDPNCIDTDPYSLIGKSGIQSSNYTIRFQNEGTAPAQNVTLDFSVYEDIYHASFIASSDYCTLTQPSPGKWNIYFPNINLPGTSEPSAPPYDNTIGWVKFALCFDITELDTSVFSDVDIYFDFEPPVSAQNTLYRVNDGPAQFNCSGTNTQWLVDSDFSKNESSTTAEFSIFPNPCHDIINILPLESGNYYSVQIMTTSGQVVYDITDIKNEHSISLDTYPTGVYFVKTTCNGASFLNRISKF